jgi:hypothetical protein
MSNHGKESTNKEGVNIDETQTKIDMGKLITSSLQVIKYQRSNMFRVRIPLVASHVFWYHPGRRFPGSLFMSLMYVAEIQG